MAEIQTYQSAQLKPMDEPEDTPSDWYEDCVHASACRAQLVRQGCWYEAEEEVPYHMDGLASLLGCGEDCEEYEDGHIIPSWSCGVMRGRKP